MLRLGFVGSWEWWVVKGGLGRVAEENVNILASPKCQIIPTSHLTKCRMLKDQA